MAGGKDILSLFLKTKVSTANGVSEMFLLTEDISTEFEDWAGRL